MYNSIIYDIDGQFPTDPEFTDLYNHYLKIGTENSRNIKITILSIIRNISNEYRYVLRKTKEILSHFHTDSIACIYENDSIDNTNTLIENHIKSYPGYENFHVYSEILNTQYMPLSKSKTRTQNLANARNKCYNVSTNILSNPNFYLVLDMDFLDISINGLMNSFGWIYSHQNISAICGNSYIDMSHKNRKSFQNYDSFAFRLNYWNYSDPLWFPYFRLPIGSPPIAVNSGFGGSCIYRNGYYKDMYGGEDCEHVVLHKRLKLETKDFNLFYNPSQIMLLN